MKKVPRMRFLDKLHKGVVVVCIGLTLYGTGLIGHRVYRYFTVIRPQRDTADLKMLEESPLDASTLIDNAPKLRS